MSLNRAQLADKTLALKVVENYCSTEKPVVKEVASRLGMTPHTVQAILKQEIEPERLQMEKRLRYSRSKMGEQNPMRGKYGSLHHNYIGDIPDGKGYLMRKVSGKYQFVHQLVMLQSLGLARLPKGFVVHHIDEDKQNNALNNLCLLHVSAHRKLHAKRSEFQKLPLWIQLVRGISKSKKTIRIVRKAS